MGIWIGKRAGEYGVFVAPQGVNAKTCNDSQLTYSSLNQAQIVTRGSYDFVSGDIYQTDFYRKIISLPDQGIVPICDVRPNMNILGMSGGTYRADQSTWFLSGAVQMEIAKADFKFKVTETQLEVICHKALYAGFSYDVMNKDF